MYRIFFYTLLIILNLSSLSSAQQKKGPDLIINKNNDSIFCRITKETKTRVFYIQKTTQSNIALTDINSIVKGFAYLKPSTIPLDPQPTLNDIANYDFTKFKPLSSYGEMPRELEVFYDPQNISPYIKRDEKLLKEMENQNSFSFGIFLSSGAIRYNDLVSVYLNSIAKQLLKKRPEITDKIHVYALSSSTVNAFATSDGKIFVSTGLLARLQNKAQLAFILGHEITHYIEAHGYFEFENNVQIKKKQKSISYSKENYEHILKTKFKRSRNQEFDADSLGLKMLLDAGFETKNIDGVFDILALESYSCLNSYPDKHHLENGHYHLTTSLWLPQESVAPIQIIDSTQNLEFSTHPALKSRKEKVLNRLSQNEITPQITDTDEFVIIKDLCLFEMVNTAYENRLYTESIYLCISLLDKYPNNEYLYINLVRSLAVATIEKYQNIYLKRNYDEVNGGNKEVIENYLNFATKQDLYVASMDLLLSLKSKFPLNKEIDLIYRELVSAQELHIKNNSSSIEGSEKEKKEKLAITLTNSSHLLKDELTTDQKTEFIKFANGLDSIGLPPTPYEYENALIVLPFVFMIGPYDSDKIFWNPVSLTKQFTEQVSILNAQHKLNLSVLSGTYPGVEGADGYNNYSEIIERLAINDSMTRYTPSFDNELLVNLRNKYGTTKVAVTSVFFMKNPFLFKFWRFLFCATLLPPGGPGAFVGLIPLLTFNYTAFYSTKVYDLRNGKEIQLDDYFIRRYLKPRIDDKHLWKSIKNHFNE